jgi:hypothetical protein
LSLPYPWFHLGPLWIALVQMTPEVAAYILEHYNDRNRPLSHVNWRRIAKGIKEGKWILTGEPIILDWDCQIQSAQHRLQAIVKSGIAVEMLVVYGVDPCVFRYIDSGRSKSIADRAAAQGIPNHNETAATCNILITYLRTGVVSRSAGRREKHEISDVANMLRDWPSISRSVTFSIQARSAFCKKFGGGSPLSALHWIFSKANREDADSFFCFMNEYAIPPAPKWSALRLLADRLNEKDGKRGVAQGAEGLTQDGIFNLCVTAWNAIQEGRLMKCLKPNVTRFPHVAGWEYDNGIPMIPEPETPDDETDADEEDAA